MSTSEPSDNREQLAAVLLEDDAGDDIYVFYPRDVTDEDLNTTWIRSRACETAQLTDQL